MDGWPHNLRTSRVPASPRRSAVPASPSRRKRQKQLVEPVSPRLFAPFSIRLAHLVWSQRFESLSNAFAIRL